MATEGKGRLGALAEKLARLFVGRLPVRRLEVSPREPVVTSSRRVPSIARLCLVPQVHGARCLDWGRLPVRTTAMGPLRYEVTCHGGPLLRQDVSPRRAFSVMEIACRRVDARRLVSIPQERSNRIRFLGDRWKPEGASALALFSPIIKDSLFKSVLDKQTGSLLCWVNPSSRAMEPFFLVLLRRRNEKGQSLEWLWFPLPGE
ncbi:hypothetical protein KAR29_09755 [Aminithiophilus ramosus]|uniref:Uncharacterized protein n=2 Tax=Synergistales TaxID=649776 RepID=A0A9Q7AAH1_9BACT|nr:hypothetical protein [Aminithiophilus ramosus]QTX31638.1 hypothetical protein KAR29_09755 [Aminithiophilus ramosus]QVL35445.1 hypothetical protein KIH16_09595 [Synergistota bacterium]